MHSHLSSNSADPPGKQMQQPYSEENYIDLVRHGDGPAFAELFHRYNLPLCTYLTRLLGNNELARDLTQETFIRAWKSLPGLHGDLQFKPWLYRIATNLAYSHMRHEKLIRWFPWHEQTQYESSSPLRIDGPENNVAEAEKVQKVLTKLIPQARICLLLQLVAGFSQREIANMLNISEKSVSAYVSRGRSQFRQLYQQAEGEIK